MLTAVVALSVTSMATLASAGPIYPPNPQDCVQTNQPSYDPGERIRIKGAAGCARGFKKVKAFLDGVLIGSTQAGEDGSYLIRGRIPNDTERGRHRLRVEAKPNAYVKWIRVNRGAAQEMPASRSSVASQTLGVLVPGLTILGLAAIFLLAPRRRRRPAASSSGHEESADVPLIDTSGFAPQRVLDRV